MEDRRPERKRAPDHLKRQSLKREYRFVTPAVRLERKNISMINPPPPGQQQQQQQQEQATYGPARDTGEDTARSSGETPGSGSAPEIPGSTRKGHRSITEASVSAPGSPSQSPRSTRETGRSSKEAPRATQETMGSTTDSPGSTSDDAPRSTPRSTSIVGEKGPLEEDTGSSSLAALPPNGHRQCQEEEPMQQQPTPPPKEPQRPQELQQQPQVLTPLSMQPPVLSTAPVAACTRGSKEIPKIRTEDLEEESAETLHQELTETTEEEAFFLSKATQELTTTKERSEEEGDSTTPQLQALPLHPTERVDTRDELSRLAAAAATSRPIVQAAQRPPKRESAQVMEFFEQQDLSISSEHEHSLDEVSQSSLLVVPSGHHHHHHHHHGSLHQRGQRSPSPSSLHASVGLSHLDNLIRLMEQLSTLRDENLKLRKKCDYLETTKKLLQVRSEMHGAGGEAHSGEYMTLPPKHKHKAHHHHHHHHHHRHPSATEYVGGKVARPRLASAEDIEYPDICESASDHRPKRPKGVMHKRSFSTGSLEVEILDETTTSHGREHLIPKSKSGKSVFSAKSPKQKSKSSKWARVKKVLTGQKLYEDLGTTIRSLKELGRSTQRYSTASTDFSPPTHRVTDHRSVDSGVSTSLDADSAAARLLRTSSSSAEASSAGRSPNHTGEGGGVEELGTEIWMGPPGWWEQYEARKHSETSNSSEVSSVIEVKTMYLGSKQKDTERLLKVKPLIRRQSSPSLITKDMEGDEDDEDDEGHQIHRSSSYKGEELDLPVMVASSAGKEKKLHQKAWGRVKEMIHVRKDSMKKRRREKQAEGSEWSQGEEISEVDMEGLMEEQLSAEFGEGIMSRSTPKTSPMIIPRQGAGSKSLSESPPRGQGLDPSSPSLRTMAASAGSADMAAMLAGSMSEEFTQKMLEWQALQLRKSSSFRITQQGEAEGEGSCVDGTTPGDRETQELLSTQSPDPERTGRARAVSLGTTKELESPTEGITSELTPLELIGPSVNVEDLQRRISESFSRKLAEWERRKYRRPTTPEMEPKGSRRKEKEEPRVRSKKTREDKERERQEKLREREIQKVEKEQVKLEKEKVRIEKERIRAMERQAKLERMKGRLSQLDSDSAPPPSSPAPTSTAGHTQDPRDPKVAAQFQRKLEELEARKDAGVAAHVDVAGASPQPSSFQPQFTIGPASGQQRPPPLTLQPCAESPEERSPVDRTSDISLGDDSTSITEENLTKANIASLERANNQLLVEVQKKEQEYGALQDEVNKLNTQLAKVRQEHASEMARFKRELEAGEVSGPVQVDVSDLEQTMRELEERIVMMENAGDQLAESMESAAIGKWQSIEGEEAVSGQLVDMVEQMKSMLVQASHSRESSTTSVSSAAAAAPPPPQPPPPPTTAVTGQEKQSEKSMALHNFEQVYSHAMKLQVQMNNLRVSQLERNKEIMLIKRQLLLQEVNNVLLQAHITRRESELYQYREAKKHANVRRWNTFTSSDTTGRLPLASSQGDTRPQLLRNSSLQENDQAQAPGAKHGGKHDDIPYITEDVSIPEAGVAAEPGVKKKGASSIATTTPAATTSTTTIPAKRPEQSTDHLEQHMASPIADTTTTEEQKTGAATTATVATGASLAVQAPKSSAKPPAADTAKHKTSTPVASKVETGSPTLLTQTTANGSATVPADGAGPTRTTKTETLDTPIPKGPLAGTEPSPQPAASAPPVDDTYSPTESVIVTECTKSAVDRNTGEPQGPDTGSDVATGSVDFSSREQAQPTAVRSPVSKQKYLRRQKEEREKHKEKKLASPKSPHRDVASGKPPLPRQSTPQSPNTAQRSKSVGDMDGIEPNGATAEQPLKGVIERFEKRATVCETEERKIEFRKTPSPTLHLPRVGLVSRVRRLKPAAELLEESQRYRSGHSIYATRIMNRYLPAQPRSGTGTPTSPTPATSSQDKENISGTSYVQAIVKRLSRENTPVKSTGSSSTNSSLSLHRTDSPHAHSEFVAHLVHKLSSSSGPESHKPSSSHSPSMPLKDLTNDGQVKKLAQVFSEEPRPSPDQPEMEPGGGAPGQPGVAGRSPSRQRGVSGASAHPDVQPDSTISPASHASMPALASQQAAPEDGARGRAATYCTSEADRPRQQQRTGAHNGGSIEQLSSEDLLDPSLLEVEGNKISPSSSTKSKNVLCCQSSACNRDKSNNHKSQTPGSKNSPASPKSQERRGGHGGRGERMETIGVLCKQSMSFDLGVSLRAQSPELAFRGAAAVGAEPSAAGLEGAKARPSSTSSEGDTTSSEDKKKSRSRFLDSSWLQKPKKFFKVSK